MQFKRSHNSIVKWVKYYLSEDLVSNDKNPTSETSQHIVTLFTLRHGGRPCLNSTQACVAEDVVFRVGKCSCPGANIHTLHWDQTKLTNQRSFMSLPVWGSTSFWWAEFNRHEEQELFWLLSWGCVKSWRQAVFSNYYWTFLGKNNYMDVWDVWPDYCLAKGRFDRFNSRTFVNPLTHSCVLFYPFQLQVHVTQRNPL